MATPLDEQTADFYVSAHQRLADLVAGLTDEQLATPVPGTPDWSVRDVIAHLAAIPTDALSGRLQGLPTDDFTAGQVADRRDRPVAELLEEWAPNVGPMADGARAGLVPPNLAIDILTHEQDIRGALGLEPVLTGDELRFATFCYSVGCGRRIKSDGVPALRLVATDSDFQAVAGEGEPAATVSAAEFELFRALSGRRSKAQVAAYKWEAGSEAYLDRINVFGLLPAADVIDP